METVTVIEILCPDVAVAGTTVNFVTCRSGSRYSTSIGELKSGHVVTVEPGLYYPALGGVRLEDVALVTNNGARNLTRFEKVLEI